MNKKKRRSTIASLPYIVWMILFTVLPLAMVCYFAFTNQNGQFTLDNLANASKYFPVLLKSIYLAAISTAICLLIAYPIAYIMSRKSEASQKLMVALIMLPTWMNFLIRTYALMTILEDNGLINSLLRALHLPTATLINTEGAVILGMVYNYLPFMVLPLYSIMTKIDRRVISAAQDLGAGTFDVARRVILPLSVPGITSGVTMTFVPAVSTFVISNLLGGNDNFLIGDLIEQQFLGNNYNLNYGAATSLVLMIIVLISMGIFNQFDNEEMEGSLL